jgi:hypothetical protein
MLFFSPILYPLLCITFLYKPTSSSFVPTYTSFSTPLLHVPSKLGCYYNCILIYEWFYNSYFYYISSINSLSHTPSYTKIQRQKQKRYYTRLSLHHLLFFIYILTNFTITLGVHQDLLSIHSLGLLPLIICGSFLLSTKVTANTSSATTNHSLPTITAMSTDSDKLCYLTAWQSAQSNNTKLLRFSSDRAVCIDTGASCCISNNKSDFLTFAPSSSTVLKGIGSGLHIAGAGTVKWTITNDESDEITIHLHNTLYVPEAPMCLLSPQHMAQQTTSNIDGFHSMGKFGILTFSGFKRTIHYNATNNLPILFLTNDFSP